MVIITRVENVENWALTIEDNIGNYVLFREIDPTNLTQINVKWFIYNKNNLHLYAIGEFPYSMFVSIPLVKQFPKMIKQLEAQFYE